jgi:predicted phosphohydrolase
MKRYAWLSDTHMNLSALPFLKRLHVLGLERMGADGVFITGDVSSGNWIESDLRFLTNHFSGPIYFVLGNHDYHGRHIASVHDDIRRLCQQHSNLIWMTEAGVVSLNEDVALIGAEGWYDAQHGDEGLLKYTTDWFRTFDFLHAGDHSDRISMWRRMASESADRVSRDLEAALQTHKTVYVLTHFPPWKEATRDVGTLMEKFWLPYNTNCVMGEAIERVVDGRRKKRVVVLAGHTHTPCRVRVTNSIECVVAGASYFGKVRPEETVII